MSTSFLVKVGQVISLLLILVTIIGCKTSDDNNGNGNSDAVSPIPQDCKANALCRFAAETANRFANQPERTCFRSDTAVDVSESSPDIDLGEDLHAYTSAGGWLDFALRQADSGLETVYQEISALKESSIPWTRAYLYQEHFQKLSTGERTSSVLAGDTDLANLQTGDILAWCKRSWCDGTSTAGSTGYVAVVIDVTPIQRDQVKARLRTTPEDAQFWQVSVVDSSYRVHGSLFTDSLTVIDQRYHSGKLNHASCSLNGGLGAGVIILAQWEDERNEKQWGFLFFNEPNHFFRDSISYGQVHVAFGRPL